MRNPGARYRFGRLGLFLQALERLEIDFFVLTELSKGVFGFDRAVKGRFGF